jgi:hypothetical protein
MPSARARQVAAVGLTMKPVGKPGAGNLHVRFDERGGETERYKSGTAPFLDSTDQGKKRHILVDTHVSPTETPSGYSGCKNALIERSRASLHR